MRALACCMGRLRAGAALVMVGALVLGGAAACQYSNRPASGEQKCAPPNAAMRCPPGYRCGEDEKCYLGDPPEAGADRQPSPDGPREAGQPPPSAAGRAGLGTVAGGTVSVSRRYQLHMTTGGGAPSEQVRQSSRYRLVGGTSNMGPPRR